MVLSLSASFLMKPDRRHIRILILMIISLLLLTAFVAYWLRSQYRSEKEQMLNELSGFYDATYDEMIDTLLFRSYVHPVISGRNTFIARRDSAGPDTVIVRRPGNDPGTIRWKSNNIITVNIRQGADTLKPLHDSLVAGGMTDDMILRSVRLIVQRAGDSSRVTVPHATDFALDIDTGLFRKRFNQRMNDAGMTFPFAWRETDQDSVRSEVRKFIPLGPVPGSSLPVGFVSAYTGYLMAGIIPQIIFGVLLLFLVALAFLLSYRNIHEHMILNRLRNEFIANIAHELRTPVATLSVALESLGRYNLRQEPGLLDEYLRLASLETHRLGELIDRVLDQTVLEDNSQLLNRSITDINTLLAGVIDIMRPRTANGTVSLTTDDEKALVNGDPLLLRGVFVNLVDNSIKYCDKDPVIEIHSYHKGDSIVIEINDNGPGIPEEYQGKIFEKFFRLPTDNVHNVKGYGLGLSFAAHVVTLHGGTVTVRNLSQGCSFIITLPAE